MKSLLDILIKSIYVGQKIYHRNEDSASKAYTVVRIDESNRIFFITCDHVPGEHRYLLDSIETVFFRTEEEWRNYRLSHNMRIT